MAIWLTTPLESNESGNLVMGTVRKDVDKFRNNPRFRFRIDVTWRYEPDAMGMPREEDSELMEKVGEALNECFAKDPVAVLTGVYTGEGARDYVFYTLSLHIFQKKFNETLSGFPVLPLDFSAEEDAAWEEHSQMLEIAMADDAALDD